MSMNLILKDEKGGGKIMDGQQTQKMNEINKALDQLQEDKADTEALKQAKANDDGYRVSLEECLVSIDE